MPSYTGFPAKVISSLKWLYSKKYDTTSNKILTTVCPYHVTYAFQRESTLYSCLNDKELLAWNRREIWNMSPVAVTKTSDFAPVLSKVFLDIQGTIECGFTLKRVRHMIRTYSQMHRTYKYSQHSSIIWPVWLNGWVFVYKLYGCGFESRCSHLKFSRL